MPRTLSWHPCAWIAEFFVQRRRPLAALASGIGVLTCWGIAIWCPPPEANWGRVLAYALTFPLPYYAICVLRQDQRLRSLQYVFWNAVSPLSVRQEARVLAGESPEEFPRVALYIRPEDWQRIALATQRDRAFLEQFHQGSGLYLAPASNDFLHVFDSLDLYRFLINPDNQVAMRAFRDAIHSHQGLTTTSPTVEKLRWRSQTQAANPETAPAIFQASDASENPPNVIPAAPSDAQAWEAATANVELASYAEDVIDSFEQEPEPMPAPPAAAAIREEHSQEAKEVLAPENAEPAPAPEVPSRPAGIQFKAPPRPTPAPNPEALPAALASEVPPEEDSPFALRKPAYNEWQAALKNLEFTSGFYPEAPIEHAPASSTALDPWPAPLQPDEHLSRSAVSPSSPLVPTQALVPEVPAASAEGISPTDKMRGFMGKLFRARAERKSMEKLTERLPGPAPQLPAAPLPPTPAVLVKKPPGSANAGGEQSSA